VTESHSFTDVFERLRAGDPRAAGEVFDRFQRRLLALAERRLAARLRPKLDPEDVLQSVYKSFFQGQAAGGLAVGGWDGAWKLLTLLTVRKCANAANRLQAGRRDARREAAAAGSGDDSVAAFDQVDREPTPDEAAALAETLEHLLAELPPRERDMIALFLQGRDVDQISTEVDRARRTVRRVVDQFRARLRELLIEEPSGA
jgi:RNA polymerase sigma-70 factor (ECF subfamily)